MNNKHKVIDLSYLNEISGESTDLISDLIEIFFKQIPEYQKSMNNYFSKKEWINLGKIAHKAKSAILMIGMKELADDLKKLEENTKEGKNINEYNEIIAKFVSESNVAIKELHEIKKNHKI